MKTRSLANIITAFSAMAIFGCGGGGGGGPTGPTAPPAGSVTLSGAAVKGPISGGDITVFGIKNGQVDRSVTLATGKTAADGSYSLTISPSLAPAGPVVIEVIGGTYTDESSATAGVTLKTPLRAVVSSAADGDKISVTPFTELAYKRTEGVGTFSATVIDDSNLKIGQTFGVDNIVRSRPFDATKTAPATATADDKKYAAALGAFSQMVADSKGTGKLDDALVTIMSELETEVHDLGGFLPSTVNSYNTAVSEFSSKNKSGATVAPIVFKAGVLSLSTSGTLAQGTAINGIDITVTLPAGVTVKADAISGETSPGVILPSSGAVSNSIATGKYTPAANGAPATLRIIMLNVQPGFAIGEFAHVNFDGFPTTGSFTAAVNQISGGNNPAASPAILTGITITDSFSGL